jgi:GDP-4-dehydro-6-deoxy-D-mannose reductase
VTRRALVTGASGFVGQWLCAALVERGDTVIGTTVDLVPPAPAIRPAVRDAVQWIHADLRVRGDIAAALDAAVPDAVFHLAGVTFVPAASADPGQAYDVNVVAAARLLAEIAGRRVAGGIDPMVVVVGSGEQYGRHDGPPIPETAPQQPLTVYAATKAAQEVAALQAWRGSGVRVVCARSFNHTGPGQADHFLVPALVRRVVALRDTTIQHLPIGNTTPIRDFLHVSDVVSAYLLLAERGQPGESYNVCSGRGQSVGEIAALVLERAGVQAEFRPDPSLIRPVDLPVLVGDPAKLRGATGWSPRSGLPTAIDELIGAASH